MKKNVLRLGLVLLSSSIYAQSLNVVDGWQMKGTETGFSTMEAFNQPCINSVWSFDVANKSWKAYSPNATITQLISNSSLVESLTSIEPDAGFWVNGNYPCSITKDGNTSQSTTPQVVYVQNSIWPQTQSFTLDMIAGQTFKVDAYTKISFDANGFANLSQSNVGAGIAVAGTASGYGDSNATLRSDGTIIITSAYPQDNRVYTSEVRVLASSTTLGYITAQRSYDENSKSYYENIGMALFDTAVESPVDMSTKLPYTTFNGWGIENQQGISYENNGTVTSFDKNGPQNYGNDQNFTIVDGAIVIIHEYNSTTSSYKDIEKLQIVYSLGDYDVLKSDNNYTSQNKTIGYIDVDNNNTWKSIELNSSIQTFQDLFSITQNYFNDSLYDLSTSTFTSAYSPDTNTFSLSSDGKTLTSCYAYGNEKQCRTPHFSK